MDKTVKIISKAHWFGHYYYFNKYFLPFPFPPHVLAPAIVPGSLWAFSPGF